MRKYGKPATEHAVLSKRRVRQNRGDIEKVGTSENLGCLYRALVRLQQWLVMVILSSLTNAAELLTGINQQKHLTLMMIHYSMMRAVAVI